MQFLKRLPYGQCGPGSLKKSSVSSVTYCIAFYTSIEWWYFGRGDHPPLKPFFYVENCHTPRHTPGFLDIENLLFY